MRPTTAALTLLVLAGCTAIPEKTVRDAVSPAPYQPWVPPPKAQMPPAPSDKLALEIPEQYLKPGTTLALVQLVDLALRSNPATREAWSFARAAAAEVGSKSSLYFPRIEVNGQIQRQKQAAVGGRFTFLQTTYGPSVAASWLLFDFGGREADVQEATRALYAADWTHNAAIQDVVLQVARAYYGYLNAKALVVARQVNLEEARKNLDAAQERHRAGVATIADVLQSKTVVSQIQLNLQSAEGLVQIIRGALATAVGVPATVPVDVGELPRDLPLDMVKKSVDELIAQAVTQRPDLAAARFRTLAAESHIRSVLAEGLPSLSLGATGNRTFYHVPNADDPFSTNYSGLLVLRIPVFTGFDTVYKTQKAREEAEAAKASAETLADQVILSVWSSYYAVQTAIARVNTSRDLLASAEQAAEVNRGRYKAGVGSILDLLTAEGQLADARSEEVQARSLWFLAIAELAHATGALVPRAAEITGAAAQNQELP